MQELQQNQLAANDVAAITEGGRIAIAMQAMKDLPY